MTEETERRAVVVDDEVSLQKLLTRWMTEFGYEVVTVATAEDALTSVENTLPNVIVTDILMPGHDGLWLLRQLRARWPTLPVIMVSGAESENVVLEAKSLGAVAFVPKPFAREMLYQAVLKATTASPAGTTLGGSRDGV